MKLGEANLLIALHQELKKKICNCPLSTVSASNSTKNISVKLLTGNK